MKNLVVRIYDFLSAHKWIAWTFLAIMLVLSGILVSRMHYQEDISAFLPQDEIGAKYSEVYKKLGGQDKIAVFFSVKDTTAVEDETGAIMDAMDMFGSCWEEVDTAGLVTDMQICTDQSTILEVFNFISRNWPYFLEEADYERADSLLAEPDYLENKLAEDKYSLSSLTSVVTSKYLRTDPAGLFVPALGRLSSLNPTDGNNVIDGYLFTKDGHTGVAFFTSPFGDSESGRNSVLVSMLDKASEMTEEACPDVTVSSVGGPIVAVGNASRIKKDSILSVSLALVLILLILFFSYRRFSDVFWIAFSIICGALFSLGLIAIFKSSISIIILGIGAMIIGIAVNYPLHYIDHLKYQPDKRQALKEQVTPLLVGNITTVGAFLSLMLMKAGALRDFGLVGALMLVGTILFVLIFLPALATGRKEKATNTIKLDLDRNIHLPAKWKKAVFAVFLVLTCIFMVASRKISFDSDMHNINYMTPEQSHGFDVLASLGADSGGRDCIYAVAEAAEAESALEEAEEVYSNAISLGDSVSVSSLCPFLPSKKEQAVRLARWTRFLEEHPTLEADIRREAARQGFSESAFAPFYSAIENSYEIEDIDFFEPLTSTIGKSMFLPSDDKISIVTYVRTPEENVPSVKASLSAAAPDGSFFFDATDVSNRLVALLSEDFDKIGLLCSMIVFFFLWLSFGSLELSLVSFLPLAVGWVWILGFMQLTGLQFNIVNIILATFIFGMGDDYTIFMTEGLMYEYACGKKILMSFKNSVVLSSLIMFMGIGVLVIAKHPAMRSIGLVTVIGMFTVVMMAYYLPPLVFKWITTKKGEIRQVPLTLGRIWDSLMAVLFYILACIICVPIVCLAFIVGPATEKKKLKYHKFLQGLARFIIFHVPGTKFTWSNPYGEDFTKPAVYICNHQSHLDEMAAMMLTPKLVIMTNDWVWNNKLYGPLIHRAEFYPATEGYEKNLDHLRDLVSRGYSVLIYPEGTRSVDCNIQRFHRGAFQLAKDLGVDVVPLFIHGFGYVLPKKDFMLRKGNMYMEIGKRVPLAEIDDDLKVATRFFHHLYIDEYARIRREKETPEAVAPLVRYNYLYKGTEAMAECRKALSKASIAELSKPFEGTEMTFENAGYGCRALLFALSHQDVEVYAHETDEEKRLTAMRCQAVPSNLHYLP